MTKDKKVYLANHHHLGPALGVFTRLATSPSIPHSKREVHSTTTALPVVFNVEYCLRIWQPVLAQVVVDAGARSAEVRDAAGSAQTRAGHHKHVGRPTQL